MVPRLHEGPRDGLAGSPSGSKPKGAGFAGHRVSCRGEPATVGRWVSPVVVSQFAEGGKRSASPPASLAKSPGPIAGDSGSQGPGPPHGRRGPEGRARRVGARAGGPVVACTHRGNRGGELPTRRARPAWS